MPNFEDCYAAASQPSEAIRGVVPAAAAGADAIPRVKLVLLGESGRNLNNSSLLHSCP